MGAVGRAVGGVVVTQCDRSRRAVCSGPMSSWLADSLATLEERSWRSEPSFLFSLPIPASWVLKVSSWLVMATMPETVAHRIERMEHSPAVIDCSAWGERS